MRSVWFWSLVLIAGAASLGTYWLIEIPLGVPGEWTWPRHEVTPDFLANLLLAVFAGAAYLGFVAWGFRRLSRPDCSRWENTGWQFGLAAMAGVWIWTTLGTGATGATVGRWPFVLYYPSSSGYFFKARYEAPDVRQFLKNYGSLMAEGDVLHVGTHPPGLFVFFHGLIAAVGDRPELVRAVNDTQPAVVRKSFDEIERNSTSAVMQRKLHSPPLSPADRAVLWLAALISFGLSAATVWPLYGFLRQDFDRPTSWLCASVWPLIPAIAIFLPKSDVAYAFPAMLLACLWRSAWRRKSWFRAGLAGAVWSLGLLCSLAFLPVALWLALLSLFESCPKFGGGERRIEWQRAWRTILPAGLASLALLTTVSFWGDIPLWKTFWLNYRNHAGFYAVYPRTYGAWLLANPVELVCAIGAPLAVAVGYGIWRSFADRELPQRNSLWAVCLATLIVWGWLWLSGKNSGEAARLWIFLMPYSVCCSAGSVLPMAASAEKRKLPRLALAWLGCQAVVCLLTVQRINGFPIDG